jgi:DNA-binding NarL/FixJ family response regulator
MQPIIDNEASSQPGAETWQGQEAEYPQGVPLPWTGDLGIGYPPGLPLPWTGEHLLQMLNTVLLQVGSLQNLVRNSQEREHGGNELGHGNSGASPYEQQQADLDTLRGGLTAIERITREAIYEIRSAGDWDELGAMNWAPTDTLVEALSRAVDETAESLGLSSRVAFNGEERPLPGPTERLLYRIAQEALYQVQQHSNARKLRFALSYGRDEVQMSIEDDGTGRAQGIAPTMDDPPPSQRDLLPLPAGNAEEVPIPHFQGDRSESSFGEQVPLPHFRDESRDQGRNGMDPYRVLRQRIEFLGGSLEVSTQTERGTRVLARIPYTVSVGAQFIAPNGQDAGGQRGSHTMDAINRVPTDDSTATTKVRLLVVEQQAVSRAGLKRVLESYPDLQVIGEAADGVQAVSETLELGPQVVLMDAHLPNGQSIEALRQIKQLNLDAKVLLFSAQDREEYLYETLRAGADGYVLKDIVPDELAQAVRTVARGEVLVQPQLAGRLLSRFGPLGRSMGRDKSSPYAPLTAREREVLRLLARGLRNKEIAARLIVSERTVNFHLANIYQKLNVSGRTEALSKALEQGLITA